MRGIVSSFVSEKGFGFIKGHDCKDYFFHKDDAKSFPTSVFDGQEVEFSPSATSKGYRAKEISFSGGPFKCLKDPSQFITSSKKLPEKYEILMMTNWTHSDRDPNEARDGLSRMARSLGYNSVVGIQMSRSTQSSGNYQYTVHECSGALCLVKEVSYISSQEIASQQEELSQAQLKEIEEKVKTARRIQEEELTSIKRKKFLKIILVSVVLFIIFLGLSSK